MPANNQILYIKIMNMKRSASWTAGLTLLAPVSWGTTYVTITEFLPAGRPLLVAAMRVVPAGIVLLAAALLISGWLPRGVEWLHLATLSLFNFGIFFPLLITAVYRLPGGVAAAVGGVQPLLVAVLSWLVSAARPRPRDVTIGVLAALGVALVVLRPSAHFDVVGVVAAVGANLSFAFGVVLTKRFPTPPNRVAATGWQMVLSGLILVPLVSFIEGAFPVLTTRNLVGFAYLSLMATGLAFLLWFNGIRRLPVAAPPLLGLAAPVTGAALGWILLAESLTWSQLAGFALTIGAIAYGAVIGHPSPDGSPTGTEPCPRRLSVRLSCSNCSPGIHSDLEPLSRPRTIASHVERVGTFKKRRLSTSIERRTISR
jgi:probable blue pigment (indigoidine) exporter